MKKMNIFDTEELGSGIQNVVNVKDTVIKDTAKVKYKDTVFHYVFSQPDVLLDLYKSLHPEDTTATVDDLQVITLENLMTNSFYNDLGFTVRDKLIILVEEQSTLCYNMPLRLLFYVTEEYNRYRIENNWKIHKRKVIKIPTPEFYVISTVPCSEKEMRLSDAFEQESDALELKVKIITKDEKRVVSSLNTYLDFVHTVEEIHEETGDLKYAMRVALAGLHNNTPAAALIKKEESYMTRLFEDIFDEDKILEEILEEKLEEGMEKGMEKGREKGREMAIVSLYKQGIITEEVAATQLNITKDEFRKLLNGVH